MHIKTVYIGRLLMYTIELALDVDVQIVSEADLLLG